MRALVLERAQALVLRTIDVPVPGNGQVLVRLDGCGICGSNLPVWEGRSWFTYPLLPGAPGHEGWGRIERVGPDVSGMTVGQPVALLSQHAFAECDVAAVSDVVVLPPALDGVAFPGEAIACAVNVVRRAGIVDGARVAVVGIGFLGAVIVRLAVLAGADVTAITRRRFALDVAAELGARSLVPLGETGRTVPAAIAGNGQQEFDIVIEATGVQQALDIAAQLTATRGRLVVAGYHQDGSRQVDMQLWNWRGIDVINAHEREPAVYVNGMREAARLVGDGTLSLDRLLTHRLPLADANEAFRAAVDRPDGFLKAVLTAHA